MPDVESIFFAALQKGAPGERAAYLDGACGGDAEVRRRVERLLAAAPQVGSFLDQPAGAQVTGAYMPGPTAAGPPADDLPVGTVVAGRFKLLEQIGEGGMGTVYVAEQSAPVRRKVALKLVKPGMDSRSVVARFEAERQALALMDHPNIAKVLDGGLTEQGRPFFVMEYIKGVPLTDYCDSVKLSVRERLELFATVCQAVQHAHQKGIIHRDLKPSNVLIALYDGKPVPKVIDFGLAKAIHQPLTERSLYTGHQAVLGTPLYMSPEQSELNNLDVDTRTDIYSLGVMLYELLTGTTPLDRQRFRQAAWDEMLRLIREEEPPRPSTRLSTSEALPSVAASRQTEPAKLSKLMRGDLDWIVMKALEKDRGRRYETANGFARDVHRYLADEAVEACPPSAGYRLRKFVRRNKGRVVAASLLLLALVGGIIGTSLGLVEAKRQEARAVAEAAEKEAAREAEAGQRRAAEQAATAERAAKVQAEKRLTQIEKANDILGSVFKDLNPREAEKDGKPLAALLGERLDQATAQLEGEAIGDPLAVARMQVTLGESQLGLGYPEKAIGLFATARATFAARLGPDHPDTLDSMGNLARGYWAAGKLDLALPLFEETLRLKKAKLGPNHPDTLTSVNNLAAGYQDAGKLDLALPLYEETLKLMKAKLGPNHPDTLNSMNNLAAGYISAGKLDLGLPLFEETLKLMKAKLGPDHPKTLNSMNNLAAGYEDAGKLDLALPLFEETLKLRKAKLGPDHPDTLRSMNNLASGYRVAGKLDSALPLHEETLKLTKAKLGPDHPNTLNSMNSLASGYQSAGRLDLALPLFEETLKLTKAKLGPGHPDTLRSMHNLASGYRDAGRLDLALPLFEETLKFVKAKLGPDHPKTLASMNSLAWGYQSAGRLDLALPLFEETLKLRKAKLGPDHPDTLRSMNNLALGYRDAGKLDLALPLFEETLKLTKAKLGPDHPATLVSMGNLALGYRDAGNLDSALPLFEETLKLDKGKLGPDHPDTLNGMNNLASAYRDAGRLDLAVPLSEETLKLTKAKLGPDHPATLVSMGNLATGYEKAGKLDLALPFFEESLKLRKAKLGPDHPATLTSMNSLATGYQAAGELNLALPLLEETLKLRKAKLGPDHPDTLQSMNNLASGYRDAGKLDMALPLFEETLKIVKARIGPDHPNTLTLMNNLASGYRAAGRLDSALPLHEAAARGVEKRGFRHEHATRIVGNLIDSYEQTGQYAAAEAWRRKWLAGLRERVGADSPALAAELAGLGRNLLVQMKWAGAEPVLRECLAIREKKAPDDWRTFNAKSLLGETLSGQKKYADAEPLLLAGYEGMKQRADKIPKDSKVRLPEAALRLVRLSEPIGKPDEAAKWLDDAWGWAESSAGK